MNDCHTNNKANELNLNDMDNWEPDVVQNALFNMYADDFDASGNLA